MLLSAEAEGTHDAFPSWRGIVLCVLSLLCFGVAPEQTGWRNAAGLGRDGAHVATPQPLRADKAATLASYLYDELPRGVLDSRQCATPGDGGIEAAPSILE